MLSLKNPPASVSVSAPLEAVRHQNKLAPSTIVIGALIDPASLADNLATATA